VDGVRLPKEAYYVCETLFRNDPQVHILGHWTYPAGTKKTVYVASNGDDVELFVNGRSLGHGKASNHYLFTFPDVAWEPGEIKAVAYETFYPQPNLDTTERFLAPIATDVKHTAGPAVSLRLTSITGPGGFQADGSDIALIDVEAVDRNGERCPTFQQRVDFTFTGPCIWRGGYNSGKINSINNPYLDLECGINRVSVRSTLTAGPITINARCAGLTSGSITIDSKPIDLTDGFTTALPAMPHVPLPGLSPSLQAMWTQISQIKASAAPRVTNMAGRFTATFSYSGPTTLVHIEQNAQNGKNVYVDRDCFFAGLPPELAGADWTQSADSDAFYDAADLIQIAVNAGTTVSIAHDNRLLRPAWLTSLFQPTGLSITVNGQPMRIFQHHATHEESLTLGSNADDTSVKNGNMYVVFVKAGK